MMVLLSQSTSPHPRFDKRGPGGKTPAPLAFNPQPVQFSLKGSTSYHGPCGAFSELDAEAVVGTMRAIVIASCFGSVLWGFAVYGLLCLLGGA